MKFFDVQVVFISTSSPVWGTILQHRSTQELTCTHTWVLVCEQVELETRTWEATRQDVTHIAQDEQQMVASVFDR